MPLYSATLRQLSRLPALLPVLTGALCCWWLVASAVPLLLPSAPRWRVLAQPQPLAAAGTVAAQSWFGAAIAAGSQPAPPALTVLGVVGGGRGSRQDFAVLQENGRQLALRQGERSPGGWLLWRVDGQGVIVRGQDGREQRLVLQRAPSLAAPPAAVMSALPPPTDTLASQPLAVMSDDAGLLPPPNSRLDAKRRQP